MNTYSKFAPTGFDSQGAFLPERQNWLVVPVSQTRDSGPFDRSNFDAALELLGGESDAVEVHRFGHWGPGWFEIILVQPGTPQADLAAEIETRLADYPLLDEEDYSSREYADAVESWRSYGESDFVSALDLPERCAELVADKREALDLFRVYMEYAACPYESDSGGVYFPDIKHVAENLSATEKAHLVRRARNTA